MNQQNSSFQSISIGSTDFLNKSAVGPLWSEFDDDGMPANLNCSASEIREQLLGFFRNEITKPLEFFAPYRATVGIMSLIHTALYTISAIMSSRSQDIKEAAKLIAQTQELVSLGYQEESTVAAVSRYFLGGCKPKLTNAQLQSGAMLAESKLLRGLLYCFTGSVVGFFKGTTTVRQACKLSERLLSESKNMELDTETEGAVLFALGAFNLYASCIPQKYMHVLAFLGFPSSRTQGIALLKKCAALNCLRSPFAIVLMLVFHIIVRGFSAIDDMENTAAARALFSEYESQYDTNKGVFALLRGRLLRTDKDLQKSAEHFKQATESAIKECAWLPIPVLSMYELGWVQLMQRAYLDSFASFALVGQQSSWSTVFCCYVQACCLCNIKGREHDALNLLKEIHAFKSRKINGKKLYFERFFFRRILESNVHACTHFPFNQLPLMHLEVLYMWNALKQMPDVHLREHLQDIEARRKNCVESSTTNTISDNNSDSFSMDFNTESVLLLIQGAILRELKNYAQSRALIEHIISNESKITTNKHVIWFAKLELALLHYAENSTRLQETLKLLNRAEQFKGEMDFETTLRLRIQLFKEVLQRENVN